MDKIRVVLIDVGHDHAPAVYDCVIIQDIFSVVGFGVPENEKTTYSDRIEKYKKYINYFDINDLLNISDLDAAIIETEEQNLTKYSIMAIEKGLNVHSDKPGGLNLSDFGQSELAYKMIAKKDFPSYAYLIERGETTLVEMLRDDNYRRGSHNHHFFGDIARWFITRIAGLNVVDSETVQIKPNFIENLEYASAYYELPSGKISVSWKRTDCGISLNIDSADGIEYSTILPEGYRESGGLIVKI